MSRVRRSSRLTGLTAAVVLLAAACTSGEALDSPAPARPSAATSGKAAPKAAPTATPAATAGGGGVYAHAGPGMLSPVAQAALPLVYVPETKDDMVTVIDPRTFAVVRRFAVGHEPQHVVPSYDLRTLWVNDDLGNDVVPIDPTTGRRGRSIPVADPYNLYFTPDGAHALVMAERLRRIDVRDPHTMRLQRSIHVPCQGVNHADFTADGATLVVSCEFGGKLLVIPRTLTVVSSIIDLNAVTTPGQPSPGLVSSMSGPAASLVDGASSMPQDVRLAPDGRSFVVADMLRDGVWVIDAQTLRIRTFVPTGKGAHGIYPSRDGRSVYVSNRDEGTVSVLDASGRRVVGRWTLPKGASPDMGGVSADGTQLWLSGRYDSKVYVIATQSGRVVRTIPVGSGPHGLALWPQPGRYSLGHTGNMR